MTQYEDLIASLDAFIRRYYANKLLRGALVLLTCLLGYVLMVSIGEYYLYLPVWVKILIVGLFVVLGAVALLFWILIPAAQMLRIGKLISHDQAAAIIGAHFPEVSDRLLNILQLRRQEQQDEVSRQLIAASIGQKIRSISVVPIGKAVNFSANRKYLPFLLPLMFLGVFMLFAAPNVFKEASVRLLQPTKAFEKPAPFRFTITSQPLQVIRNSDFPLELVLSGEMLPAAVSVVVGEEQIPMQSGKSDRFSYTFRNVSQDISFRFYASGYYSGSYHLKVLQRPVLKGLKLHLDYPAYTGRKDEDRNGVSDMVVPAGTNVSWVLSAEHADKAWLQLGAGVRTPLPQLSGVFAFQYRFMNDTTYSIILENSNSNVSEQYTYQVQLIPDQYPVLQLQEFRDTVSGSQIVLNGTAGDDYGISKVLFHYQVLDADKKVVAAKAVPLKISGALVTAYQHYFDVQPLQLQPGQQLNYYIEVWDNDGVHGSKASRSEMMSYRSLDARQVDSMINKSAQQISNGLNNSSRQNEQLQQEMKELQTKMLQTESMDWEQKQSLQDLARMQEQMKNNLEQIKKRFEEQVKQSEQKPFSEDLKEKQEALKDQLENLMNKELKEQMKKLQEMLERRNKEQTVQDLQQLQEQNKLFSMDMERMKELMKKLELQMRMEDMAAKMEQLAKEQSELRAKTDDAAKDPKENKTLSKEQEQLKKALDSALKKDMKEMQDLNKEMQRSQDISKEEQQAEQAKEQMQQSEEQLDQNQNGKASQSQSKAAQNLEEMAQSMRQKAGGMDMEQIEMDIRSVRQILTNLMRLSFDQEQLIGDVRQTAAGNPDYIANMEKQSSLHRNSQLIRDSLFSLSKRLFKLAPAINKETVQLERYMRGSLEALEQRRISDAATRQQYIMTHTNNLALMLNEMLSNLIQQQSQAQKSKGQKKGQCNNPGGSTPKPGAGQQLSDIISKQKSLNQSMQQGQGRPKQGGEQSDKEGEQGKKEGGQKNGGNDGNAEELVRMAQQQAAIRRQLQQLNSLLNSQGLGNPKELKEIQEQMDRNESDLVNRKLDGTLLMRQKEILSRLLEAEKSLRQQEEDNKRSSREPEELSRPVPPELQRYLKENPRLLEQYRTVPPAVKPYYKDLIHNYFELIGG